MYAAIPLSTFPPAWLCNDPFGFSGFYSTPSYEDLESGASDEREHAILPFVSLNCLSGSGLYHSIYDLF